MVDINLVILIITFKDNNLVTTKIRDFKSRVKKEKDPTPVCKKLMLVK